MTLEEFQTLRVPTNTIKYFNKFGLAAKKKSVSSKISANEPPALATERHIDGRLVGEWGRGGEKAREKFRERKRETMLPKPLTRHACTVFK